MDLQNLIVEYGDLFYLLTFAWTFLEGETFVLFASFAAAHGLLNPWVLLIAAWLGSFCGDQVYFAIGRRYGPRLIARFPRWTPGVESSLGFLRKYDTGFILTFRFIYGIRNLASFAMGTSGLNWNRFLVLNFIAAGVWAASFVGLGYLCGQAFEAVLGDVVESFGLVMLGVFITLMAGGVIVHRLQKRRAKLALVKNAGLAAVDSSAGS
jgi:membrane protein DedA with SNARE-associated domain